MSVFSTDLNINQVFIKLGFSVLNFFLKLRFCYLAKDLQKCERHPAFSPNLLLIPNKTEKYPSNLFSDPVNPWQNPVDHFWCILNWDTLKGNYRNPKFAVMFLFLINFSWEMMTFIISVSFCSHRNAVCSATSRVMLLCSQISGVNIVFVWFFFQRSNAFVTH